MIIDCIFEALAAFAIFPAALITTVIYEIIKYYIER